MTMMTKILTTGAGLAALAAAAPSVAQYPYGYSNPYGQQYAYGQQYGYGQQQYGYAMNTNVAAQQCTAAVQNRLYSRTRTNGVAGILGTILGANTATNARVLSITQARALGNGTVRVRGLATSGRYAYNNGYGAYGVGAYGAAGYAYQPDLSFRCDVDFRGNVRNVDINRR